MEEDNPDPVENTPEEGDLIMPSTLSMASPQSWVHINPSILRVGRVTHMPPEAPEEPPEDYSEEEEIKKIEAADPREPRLKEISKD